MAPCPEHDEPLESDEEPEYVERGIRLVIATSSREWASAEMIDKGRSTIGEILSMTCLYQKRACVRPYIIASVHVRSTLPERIETGGRGRLDDESRREKIQQMSE